VGCCHDEGYFSNHDRRTEQHTIWIMSDTTTQNFGLIGAAGYVAPRHMKAIRDTGNVLVAALDPHDSVGILDSYAPDASFFTEFERFDRHAEKLRRMGEEHRLHFISVCSPNYLHDAHCRFALRIGADAICEKPLVLNPWNVDALQELEEETGQRIWNVLQLRLHPSVAHLKAQVEANLGQKRHQVTLEYVTSRGSWYNTSWKGNPDKSGGVATNIGVHFFDMLIWIFGAVRSINLNHREERSIAGTLDLEHADVNWRLSIERKHLPSEINGESTFRSLTMDGEQFEFSKGFTDLHTRSFEEILAGRGFGLNDAKPAIELVHDLRIG